MDLVLVLDHKKSFMDVLIFQFIQDPVMVRPPQRIKRLRPDLGHL